MSLIDVGGDDVTEKGTEEDEERLGSEGENGKVTDVAGSESLADALVELAVKVGGLNTPEVRISIEEGAIDGGEFERLVGGRIAVREKGGCRFVVVERGTVVADVCSI